jgi:ion channel
MLLCLVLQIAFAFWSVRYYVRDVRQAPPGGGMLAGIRPLLIGMLIMMLGNFLQIVLWGFLFVWLDEFGEPYEAIYHSAVNFTSLGYGDVVMSKRWKLLGPLEALNGILMLSVTGAALMAMLQQMIKAQYPVGGNRSME